MRGAGFEPALPEEHRLKRCVLNHSTIRAKSYFCGEIHPPHFIFRNISLSCISDTHIGVAFHRVRRVRRVRLIQLRTTNRARGRCIPPFQ